MSSFSDMVNAQIKSFYSQRAGLTHRSQVDHVITDDIFSKRLELVQTERGRKLTLEGKDRLQSFNGNIVWGKTNKDTITAIISTNVFSLDSYSWRGTVHHEYTHAHDFWDLADYLQISEMDSIYDYEFYDPFDWWSEYHARIAGSLNVYRHEYARNSIRDTIHVCNVSFDCICKSLMQTPSVYIAMQELGRYSTLKNMYGAMMPALQSAKIKYGMPDSIIAVGDFLHANQDFSHINQKLAEFQSLINAV